MAHVRSKHHLATVLSGPSARAPLRIGSLGSSHTAGSFSANATLDLMRRFEPMAQFDWHSLSSIARHAREITVPAKRLLVHPPRRLQGVWYLVAGSLWDESSGERLQAGSARSRLPVYPGTVSLRTITAVRLLFFDGLCAPLLLPDVSANQTPPPGSLAGTPGTADPDHWLETLASSPLLRLLYGRRGAAGWQAWLRSFESLEVENNQTLIRQGARGDYFYIVQQGVACVSSVSALPANGQGPRLSPPQQAHSSDKRTNAMALELAQVGAGGFFGEDALLSGQRRNAAVSMPLGGRVLRGGTAQLCALVDDLWWTLARKPQAWQLENRPLQLPDDLTTSSLRDWLAALPADQCYGLSIVPDLMVQDLLILLLVHRGYSVVLRDVETQLISAAGDV